MDSSFKNTVFLIITTWFLSYILQICGQVQTMQTNSQIYQPNTVSNQGINQFQANQQTNNQGNMINQNTGTNLKNNPNQFYSASNLNQQGTFVQQNGNFHPSPSIQEQQVPSQSNQQPWPNQNINNNPVPIANQAQLSSQPSTNINPGPSGQEFISTTIEPSLQGQTPGTNQPGNSHEEAMKQVGAELQGLSSLFQNMIPIDTISPKKNGPDSFFYKAFKSIMKDQMADAINHTFHWADKNYPLALKLLQAGHALGKTIVKQHPGMESLLNVLDQSVGLNKLKNYMKKYNLQMKDYNNVTLKEAIADFTKKNDLNGVQLQSFSSLAKPAMDNPVVKSLVKEFTTSHVNGVPFVLELMYLYDHLGKIPVGSLANKTVAEDIGQRLHERILPYVENALSKPRVQDHIQKQFGLVGLHVANNFRPILEKAASFAKTYIGKVLTDLDKEANDRVKYNWG